MSESEHPTAPVGPSGNRWEPTTPPPASPPPPPLPQPPPAAVATAAAPVGAATAPRAPLANRNALVAGVAAAALLLVGAGGFVLGRTTADDGRQFPGFRDQQQAPRVPGNGFGGPGGAPNFGPGQAPGQDQDDG